MALRPRTLLVSGLTVLALLALATGCGSNGRATGPAASGTSATAYTQGVISGFGTIHLGRGANQRVFHTEGAVLRRLDDGVTQPGGGNDAVMFRVGMKVKVFHDKDDSTHAREVTFEDDLEGPITAKPSAHAGATFDVLDVPVLVDANTHFDDSFTDAGLTLDSLKVGNVLELSGEFDANGILHATFIEAEHASPEGQTFEIKGQVTDLGGSPPAQTFKVHGASFATDMNTRIEGLNGGLTDSAFVEVKTPSTSAPFLATRVQGLSEDDDDHEGDHDGSDDDHEHHHVEKAEVEGFVTGLTGTSPNFSFTLDTRHVVTSSATMGLQLVVPNAHIEAKGAVDSTGTIVAAKVSHDD